MKRREMQTNIRLELTDYLGNSPKVWMQTADDLLEANRILYADRKQRYGEYDWPTENAKYSDLSQPPPQMPSTLAAEYMLVGFAVEKLLRALRVQKGQKLYQGGKLQKKASHAEGLVRKHHDLISEAAAADFPLQPREKTTLKSLSVLITSVGRYPFSANERTRERMSWKSMSPKLTNRLLKRLYRKLGNVEWPQISDSIDKF